MVILCTSHPSSSREGNAQLIILLLSNTEKSISSCTDIFAANFIRQVDEMMSGKWFMTQCRRTNQEQLWKGLCSFRKARKGPAVAQVQMSSYLQDADAVAQCDATFRGLF